MKWTFSNKTDAKQGDGISPILFKWVLDKIMKVFRKKTMHMLGAHQRRMISSTHILFLRMTLSLWQKPKKVKQVKELKEVAEEREIHVSFQKNKNNAILRNKWKVVHRTKSGNIRTVKIFKCLGGTIIKNAINKKLIKKS